MNIELVALTNEYKKQLFEMLEEWKKDIVENDYDLSINKYKEVEYIPVEYPPTSEIMANIRELENEIGKEMDELEKLLKM